MTRQLTSLAGSNGYVSRPSTLFGTVMGAGLGPWASPSPMPDSRGARPPGATRRAQFPLRGATGGRAPRWGTMVAGEGDAPTVTR